MSDTAPDPAEKPLHDPAKDSIPAGPHASSFDKRKEAKLEPSRVVPSPAEKKSQFRVRLLCALAGAWGVATGYALFILISNRAREAPGTAVVLVVAVFVVALTEWFRDTIRGEESVSRRSLSAILSSVLLLAVFEVCVLAYEEVSEATFETPYAVKELAAHISGKEIPYAFLRPADIPKPRDFVSQLRTGYDAYKSAPTQSPAAWVAYLLGPEMQWTLFPGDAPRPQWHDALVNTIEGNPYFRAPTSTPGVPGKTSASLAPSQGDLQLESFDYDTLVHKLYFLEGLDAEQLREHSQIDMPDPADLRDHFTDFAPLMQRPELTTLANVTASNLSDEQLRDLLVIELNRMMQWPRFYNEDEFRETKTPEGVKQLLNQEREDSISDDTLNPQLRDLQRQPESENRDDKIAELKIELGDVEARLLPAPRVVQLNRELLVAAFSPDLVKPAPERFDEHGENLAVLGLLWMCAGGALGWVLAGAIFDPQGPGEYPSRRGALRGLAAALGAAPVFVVGYVLVVRLWELLRDTLHFKRELHYLWEPNTFPPDDLFNSTLVPTLLRLDTYWHHKWWSLGIAAAVVALLAAFWQFHGRRRGMSVAKRWLLFGACVAMLALAALLFDANLPFIYLLVGLVWITPGVFIGICGPYLRTGSPVPQGWGIIAVTSGLALVLLTIIRLKWDSVSPWLLVPGVVLIATGLLMRAGLRLEEYWPLGALALGLVVCGTSAVVQQATFVGVLSDVHELNVYGGYNVKLVPDASTLRSRLPKNPFAKTQSAQGGGAASTGNTATELDGSKSYGYDTSPSPGANQGIIPQPSPQKQGSPDQTKGASGSKKAAANAAHRKTENYDFTESSFDDEDPLIPDKKSKAANKDKQPSTSAVAPITGVDSSNTPSGSGSKTEQAASAEWKAAHENPYDDYFGPQPGHPELSPTHEQVLDQSMKDRVDYLRRDARGMASTGDSSMDDEVRANELSDQDRLRNVRDNVTRRLELSIVGSLGFWLTVGLLAGWAQQRNPRDFGGADGTSGKQMS